jgi:hypothetical protein
LDKYPNDDDDDEGDVDDDNKSDVGSAPVMMSQPQNFEVYLGDMVILPCATMNHCTILS